MPIYYADLRAFTSTPPDEILVQGYSGSSPYGIGDGAEGIFIWDPNSTENDNDGTIIKATSIATGRFKRVFDNIVNVKWFGAVGDGSTDDSAALQNAYNSGYCTFTPEGIYIIGTTLSLTASNVTHLGTGKKTVLKQKDNQLTRLIIYYTGTLGDFYTDFHWKDICFDGNLENNKGQLTPGIDIRDSYSFSFINCTFKNFQQYAVLLDGCHSNEFAYKNIFSQCDFDNFRKGGIYNVFLNAVTNDKSGNNLIVTNCHFSNGEPYEDGAASGIWIVGNPWNTAFEGSKNCIVASCIFTNMGDSAIIANRFTNLQISNCIAYTYGTSFYLGDGNLLCSQLIILGCTGTASNDAAIIVNKVSDFNIANNILFECNLEGLRVENSQYGSITGNTVYNNGKSGIRSVGIDIDDAGTLAETNSKFITITGNVSTDKHAAEIDKTQEYGIYLNSYSNSIMVHGNIAVGNKIKDIATIPWNPIPNPTDKRQLECIIKDNYGETYSDIVTILSATAVIDFTYRKTIIVKLGQNITSIDFVNAQFGDKLTISFVQSGSYTISGWANDILFEGGIAPIISTVLSGETTDTFVFLFNGSVFKEISKMQDVRI